MKPKLRTVQVKPVLPEALRPLERLARNIHWDWTPDISELFRRIDGELWERTSHNPIALLGQVDQARLEALAADRGFLAHLARAGELLDRYLDEPRWFQAAHPEARDLRIAYFSAEFGLAGCLPIYSGGLGILAGDHLKSASDLGVPLVGVGLLYQEGYFRQYLNSDGWQGETYPPNDFYNMPIEQARHADGSVVRVAVEFPGRLVWAQVWRIQVGRVSLYLLDTNVPDNQEQDRKITRALYSGGVELRIQQLMVLGIGGFRALVAMGLEPTVCHMNEGHAGFLGVERTRHLMTRLGVAYETARDMVEDGNIFTTHTPVPAGFDVFSRELVERHMSDYIRLVGMSPWDFMALGRRNRRDDGEPFNMAVLAIRHAVQRNGVSELHGQVSRRLVQDNGAWTDWPEDEVPIDAVTNGIHTRTWLAPEMQLLFDRYLGPSWREGPADPAVWARIDDIPGEELWRTHVGLRQQLISYVRKRLKWQLERRGAMDRDVATAASILDPDALTIGFARRVATYKRATLLFTDLDRLQRLLESRDRPVQFVFSGKAHPADQPAKELIRAMIQRMKDEPFRHRMVFLEDYEIPVAKHLITGVDVWLNNPQRPKEASGTSGMKVVPNGGLNLSILDGWWAEGYRPGLGWAIGNGEDHREGVDPIEANALYDVLESQVVPMFFDRDARGVPAGWVRMMKASMKELGPRFSTDRMVHEYVERFYLPTAGRFTERTAHGVGPMQELVAWKQKLRQVWHDVRVVQLITPDDHSALIGQPFELRARVALAGLGPEDVDVQLYHGAIDAKEEVHGATTLSMALAGVADGLHDYTCRVPFSHAGRVGYTVRVVPRHPGVLVPNELTAIRWAD
jgi:starch phosphorylase